jgi:hypothetical protein
MTKGPKVPKDIVDRLTETDAGCILFSIIIGLGLAALFRRECIGNQCIVVEGPNPNEVKFNTYKLDDRCFKYTPYIVDCNKQTDIIGT